MSPYVGTCRDPSGAVHIWYLQTLGSFEDDLVLCNGSAHPGLGGWSYCEARVTCDSCKGRWAETR